MVTGQTHRCYCVLANIQIPQQLSEAGCLGLAFAHCAGVGGHGPSLTACVHPTGCPASAQSTGECSHTASEHLHWSTGNRYALLYIEGFGPMSFSLILLDKKEQLLALASPAPPSSPPPPGTFRV